jgi:predicted dehydrogenase
MRVQWSWPAPDAGNWRTSNEVGRWWSLAGVGTHCLDLIRWVMLPECGEIEQLNSIISRSVWQGPHDETAVLAMRFASGATAEMCSSVLFQAPTRAEVYGSAGYIVCEGTVGRYGSGYIRTHEGDMDFEVVDPYTGEIKDFVEAIANNRKPEVDGHEGLRNVELLVQAAANS